MPTVRNGQLDKQEVALTTRKDQGNPCLAV